MGGVTDGSDRHLLPALFCTAPGCAPLRPSAPWPPGPRPALQDRQHNPLTQFSWVFLLAALSCCGGDTWTAKPPAVCTEERESSMILVRGVRGRCGGDEGRVTRWRGAWGGIKEIRETNPSNVCPDPAITLVRTPTDPPHLLVTGAPHPTSPRPAPPRLYLSSGRMPPNRAVHLRCVCGATTGRSEY